MVSLIATWYEQRMTDSQMNELPNTYFVYDRRYDKEELKRLILQDQMITGEDVCHAMKTLKPFIQRWGCASSMYEELCQVAHEQMARPDFYVVWQVSTIWGKK
jgi:hypothetical protein